MPSDKILYKFFLGANQAYVNPLLLPIVLSFGALCPAITKDCNYMGQFSLGFGLDRCLSSS